MAGSDSTKKNDVRGWILVHDQIRGEVADQLRQVEALRAGDTRAATALGSWWASVSGAIAHHMRSEDDRIWPQLLALDPVLAEPLAALQEEHEVILRLPVALDTSLLRLAARVTSADFDSKRADVVKSLGELGEQLGRHLDHEERLVVPVFESRMTAEDWAHLERDMVTGLSQRELADLLPRMLHWADPATKAMMLTTRLPAPVRLLDRLVFEPRYRSRRAKLPLG